MGQPTCSKVGDREACQNPQRGGRKPSSAAHTRQGSTQNARPGCVAGTFLSRTSIDITFPTVKQSSSQEKSSTSRPTGWGVFKQRGNSGYTKRGFLPHVPRTGPGSQRKKEKDGRSDFHRHPPRLSARRQDLRKPGYRSSPLSIQPRHEASDRHLCRQDESKKGPHCRAPRISFINPGGICGSFREHKRGRIL